MDTDSPPQWEDENPPVYNPSAPTSGNGTAGGNIAFDASGKAQFATIDVPDEPEDAPASDNAGQNSNSNDEDTGDGDELELGSGGDAAAAAAGAPSDGTGGESYKQVASSAVYDERRNVGEGAVVAGAGNGQNYQRLPPWFESTGNASVDYKLARARFCCCSLRAGVESIAIACVLISIWDLLISAQFAEEQVLVSLQALFRILGGLVGFYGAWKYNKNASKVFWIFWIVDMVSVFILLIYSVYLINNCDESYEKEDEDGDWFWWYDHCKYKYENLTGLYLFIFLIEIYCVVMTRKFSQLMSDI